MIASDIMGCITLSLGVFFIIHKLLWLRVEGGMFYSHRSRAPRRALLMGIFLTWGICLGEGRENFRPDIASLLKWAPLWLGIPLLLALPFSFLRTLTKVVELTDEDLLNYPSYGWSLGCPNCGFFTKVRGFDCDGAVFPCHFCGSVVRTRRDGNRITTFHCYFSLHPPRKRSR